MPSIVIIGLIFKPAGVSVFVVTELRTAVIPSARPRLSAYWLAWVATITFFAGFYALLVPLPRYLARAGFSDWQIGFVLGTFGVAALLGRPLSGVAVDRVGARATMLFGAASLTLGALGVGTTDNLGALLGLRISQAIGYVAFTTAGTSLVVALAAPDERAGKLATYGAAANIAISLTPAAVGAALVVAPLEVGLLASAACASVAGLISAFLPTAAAMERRAARDSAGSFVWASRRVLLAMAVTGLLGAGFAAFFQFAPILADRRALPPGLLYGLYGAAIIATRLTAGQRLDRFRVPRVVATAATLMALGCVLIAISESLAPLLLGVGMVAVSGGLFHPVLLAHHAALLPETPGRASAAFYIAFDLGIGLGSWILGVVLQVAGVTGLYLVAALSALAVLPLAPRLSPRT